MSMSEPTNVVPWSDSSGGYVASVQKTIFPADLIAGGGATAAAAVATPTASAAASPASSARVRYEGMSSFPRLRAIVDLCSSALELDRRGDLGDARDRLGRRLDGDLVALRATAQLEQHADDDRADRDHERPVADAGDRVLRRVLPLALAAQVRRRRV